MAHRYLREEEIYTFTDFQVGQSKKKKHARKTGYLCKC